MHQQARQSKADPLKKDVTYAVHGFWAQDLRSMPKRDRRIRIKTKETAGKPDRSLFIRTRIKPVFGKLPAYGHISEYPIDMGISTKVVISLGVLLNAGSFY